MNQETKNTSLCYEESPSRPSFREAFRRAAKQVELECSEPHCAEHLRELCYIIAEVYMLDPYSRIKVSNELLDAYLVQEIFQELTHEHLRLVYDNFRAQTRLIRNKRAYLRTALYNSVFELNAHFTNLVTHDLAGDGT